MFKKILFLTALFLLIFACKKRDELEIEKEDVNEVVAVEEEKPEIIEESKPLIILTKDDIVKILVRADGAPGMWLGEDGEVYGFYVDLERLVFEEMGQKYEFVPYTDVGVAAQGLKTGTSHVALAVPDLADYRSFLNLSLPYETLNYITFVHNDNNDIKGETKEELLKSLSGKKVGVQVTGFAFQSLRDNKDLELVEYATTTKAMEGLHNREVDAVIENRETGSYYVKQNNWDLKPVSQNILNHRNTSGFSMALDTSIVDRYNEALQRLFDNGSVDKLHKEYYGEAALEYRR